MIAMAPILGKRSHNDNKQKVRKRQRIDPRRANARSKSALRTVSVDSLPWKEASLSDRLEDAEGFFGLEEIDGVEVLREVSSGKVEFRVGECSSRPNPSTDVLITHLSGHPQVAFGHNRVSSGRRKYCKWD